MSLTPVDKPGAPTPAQPLPSQPVKNGAERTVESAALERLPSKVEPEKARSTSSSSSSSISRSKWSFLKFRKTTDQPPASALPASTSKTAREKDSASHEREEEVGDDYEKVEREEVEERETDAREGPDDPVESATRPAMGPKRPIGPARSTEPSDQRVQLETTAIKAYEAAKATRWQRMKEGMGSVALAIPGAGKGITKYVQSFSNFDKDLVVAEQIRIMSSLRDPQFIELYELISRAMLPKIDAELAQALAGKTDTLSKAIHSQRAVVLKLIEVILARGFANLAIQVRAIPNFERQPTLVSVISLLCQKAGEHINQRKLAEIENRYQRYKADFLAQKQQLFPGIESLSEMEQSLQMYIQEYIKSTDVDRKNQIKLAIFPDMNRVTGQRATDIAAFFTTLDALHRKDQELSLLFGQVADAILLCFFPHKLADIPELGGMGARLFGGTIFSEIKSVIANLLQTSYEPVEHDVVRNAGWERDLRGRVGTADLRPVVEAPAALLAAFAKNFIQADPDVMELTTSALDQMMNPEYQGVTPVSPQQRQRKLLNQLSLEQLANWIVESAQIMLHTSDPNISGFGLFIKQAMNNLTLALMAKGAKLVIPTEGSIRPETFVKEFGERIVARVVALGTTDIPDRFWQDFVKDLPLPPRTKELIVPLLIAKFRSLQADLRTKIPDFRAIERINEDVERRILSYKGGKDLLNISEEVSNKIVEQLRERNIGLEAEREFGDTIEDLFAQYLPGIVVSEDLKNWFRQNVSTLEGGYAAQSTVLLKKGIQTVIQKAILNMIEKNFRHDSENYIRQLFENFQKAFTRPFVGLNERQRAEIREARGIQVQIEERNNRIKRIKAEVAKKPAGINLKQNSLIEAILIANVRSIQAVNYLRALVGKRDAVLRIVNADYEERDAWSSDKLSLVKEALALRKRGTYPSVAEHVVALRREIADLRGLAVLTPDQIRDLNQRQTLLLLLEMSPEKLKLISEAVNIQFTLQHAERELVQARGDLDVKRAAIVEYEGNPIPPIENIEQWNQAKRWMQQVLESKGNINEISQEIIALERELDGKLSVFQALSGELIGLLGLDAREGLGLPLFLQDKIWPLIEKAKNQYMARALLAQFGEAAISAPIDVASGVAAPLMRPIVERDMNRALLHEKSGSDFLGNLCQALAQDVLRLFPTMVNPEVIAAKISESMPSLAGFQGALTTQIQQFIKEGSEVYRSGSDVVGAYVEGILLKVFIRIADKNPRQGGKDTLVVLTEKLLDLVARKYQETRAGRSIAEVTKELNDIVMRDILGIDSPEAFTGLPDPLKARVYDVIKDQIGEMLLRFQTSLAVFEAGPAQAAKDKAKEFGIAANATKGYAQILAEDIANMVMTSVPHVLAEVEGEGMKGVADISKNVESSLEELARGNFAVAGVVLRYTQGAHFKRILGDQLAKLADKDQLVADKRRAADLVGNLLLPVVNGAIERVINFENQHKKEFNQKLMANLLRVGAQHFKHRNKAKELAAANGRADVRHADFVAAVEANGGRLHPGVPREAGEAETLNVQRQQFAYGAAIPAVMKMIFPNDKDDLQFVPEEIRATVWNMLEKSLFPQMLPMITEMMFDPMMINQVVLNSLETMKENLQGPIVIDPNPESADRPLDELDEASGELIAEVLRSMTLPAWIKGKIVDDKGKISPAMKKVLGANLRKQFNDTFIQDKLKIALEQAVQRDKDGSPILNFDTRPREVKAAEAVKKAEQMQADLKKVSREVVVSSIDYFIRNQWVMAHARFDQIVRKLFGKIGVKLKHALDACFRFVFFTVVGTILSVIFWPAKKLVKPLIIERIYKTIALDQNRDVLIGMLTQAPADQPATGNKYAVYNEDLLFKMGEALSEVVQEFMQREPILPAPAPIKSADNPT